MLEALVNHFEKYREMFKCGEHCCLVVACSQVCFFPYVYIYGDVELRFCMLFIVETCILA